MFGQIRKATFVGTISLGAFNVYQHRRRITMTICSECGWKINAPQWWNKLDKDKWICDDCDTDNAIKISKLMGVLL